MSQKLVIQLFDNVLSFSEGTPYHGQLVLSGDAEDSTNIVTGDVIFSFDTDRLGFKFYLDQINDPINIGYAGLMAASHSQEDTEVILRIPERNFEYPVFMRTIAPGMRWVAGKPLDRQSVSGELVASCFGMPNAALSSASLTFKNMPRFRGAQLFHVHGFFEEYQAQVDSSAFSWQVLGRLELQAGGWQVVIEEVPDLLVSPFSESHTAAISKTDGAPFTDCELRDFMDDLITFLSFVFGTRTIPPITVGIAAESKGEYSAGDACWAQLRRIPKVGPRNAANWFTVSRGQEPDLSAPFRGYYQNLPRFRSHWRLTVDAYIESERLADSGQPGRALSVSVSALEGLVKSVLINLPYFDGIRDEYLFPDSHRRKGQMKPGKTKDAILYVFRETMGGGFTFKDGEEDVVEDILHGRNPITHLDLNMPAGDLYSRKTYERWRASQALFEWLMLALWGAQAFPNRTHLPKLDILGQDALSQERAGEITFKPKGFGDENCSGKSGTTACRPD